MRGCTLLLGLMVVVSGGISGASEPSVGSITVTGNAELRVVPDEVVLALGVETLDLDLARAKADNDARIGAILAVARDHGVPREHIKTDYLEVEPRYEDSYIHRDFVGFLVRRSMVITLRDLSRFEDLLSAALTAGANYVHGIDFRTTELRAHRDRARSLALVAAREKAEAMAAEYGRTVGDPTQISEGYSGWWSPYGGWWGPRWQGAAQNVVQVAGGGSAGSEGPTVPGQLAVSATVNVVFRLTGGGTTSD